MAIIRRIKKYDVNYRAGGKSYADRRYEVRMGEGMADADLEEGDTLPEDSDYRIITASIVRDRQDGLPKFIDVTAEKQVASITLLSQFSREEQRGDVTILHRTYQIALASTLSTNSIENGDALPDDADAEIIHSVVTVGGKSNLANMVQVTARKYGTWAD